MITALKLVTQKHTQGRFAGTATVKEAFRSRPVSFECPTQPCAKRGCKGGAGAHLATTYLGTVLRTKRQSSLRWGQNCRWVGGHSPSLEKGPGETPEGQRGNKGPFTTRQYVPNTESQNCFKSECWWKSGPECPWFCHPPGCPGLARKTDRQFSPPCWPAPVSN